MKNKIKSKLLYYKILLISFFNRHIRHLGLTETGKLIFQYYHEVVINNKEPETYQEILFENRLKNLAKNDEDFLKQRKLIAATYYLEMAKYMPLKIFKSKEHNQNDT